MALHSRILRRFAAVALVASLAASACVPASSAGPVAVDPPWLTDPSLLEAAIHESVSLYRRSQSLGALEYDHRVARIARVHSQNMAALGFFDHADPQGRTARERFSGSDLICGENLIEIPRSSQVVILGERLLRRQQDIFDISLRELADSIVKQWIDSPGHQRNMVVSRYTSGGVGIVYHEPTEKLYATHNLCTHAFN